MSDDTYEMFWDCRFCSTPKLLGLTHRHCPVCGAPQNAAERYFPSDADKVRVVDHQYVGRDLVCTHCGTYNSRSSRHCRDCGAPTAEGLEAPLRAEPTASEARRTPADSEVHGFQPAAALPARHNTRKRSWRALLIGCILVAFGALALLLFWKKEQTFEVAGHDWERRVEIERFGPVRQSAWCDQLPSGAREIRRYREVRSREQVPDGETCAARKVDQGDGTFREVKDCKPRYRTRELEDNRCDYEVNRWATARYVGSRGQGTTPSPVWPQLPALGNCARVGCERPGNRSETYRVLLVGPDGEATCEISQNRWLALTAGDRLTANVRVVGGSLDCSSLR